MTIAEALHEAARRIDRFDAEVLLAHLLETDRGRLFLDADRQIDAAAFGEMVERRFAHEPVAYITGHREFWSLDLVVTPDTLIPRPDSETLIEAALDAVAAPASILDLGTGSGALLLAALTEWPKAYGLGIDASAGALAVAAQNAARLGLGERAEFRTGNWGQGLGARFDLILCNPPYVETGAALAADVRDHEPTTALFAGADGLEDYRALVPQLPGLLNPGGFAVLEIGWDQAIAVTALAREAGFVVKVRRDLGGHERCVVLKAAE